MKLDFIKGQEKTISVASSGIAVLLAVLIGMKIVSYQKLSARADKVENTVQTIMTEDCNNTKDLDKYLGPTKEIADNLKKSNLFAPPPPKSNPVTQVPSIFGNEAFINNQWHKEGDMIQDAKIISIEPTQVTIEWDGQTTVFRPLGAEIASNGSSENEPPRPENIMNPGAKIVTMSPPSPEQRPEEISSPAIVMSEQPSQEQIPEEIKNAMEKMNLPSLSPEMLENMSDEQRMQFEQMIKQRMKTQMN